MSVTLESPATITLSSHTTQRDARLLVCGEYPAKNLTVTEADLDALVANFSAPVPVKVEHVDSPLDPLGLVERVWREGDALLGHVLFPASMAAFLSERGAAKLSVGLLKGPAWKLLEASLTLTPHVPTATLLSDSERVELSTLRARVRRQTVDAQIAELKASGRVIPATEALARVLLSADDGAVVTLSEGAAPVPVASAALALLRAQPPLVRLSELAAGTHKHTFKHTFSAGASGAAAYDQSSDQSSESDELDEDEGPEFSDDDHEIMKRLGVSPDDVKKTMKADKKAKAKPTPEQRMATGGAAKGWT